MSNATPSSHPLLAQWIGPCGGVPAFDQVQIEEFKPALIAALARHREELKVIADNPIPPTFENTIAAMERAGEWIRRARAPYHVWSSSMRTPEFQRVEEEMVLQLAAFSDEVFQNEKLFRRIEAVFNSPDLKSLSPEAQRLAWLNHNEFVLQGARLHGAEKMRVAQINQRLATLMIQFSQNVLGDEENQYLLVKNKSDLAGLPQALIDGAATEAARRGFKGQWVFANTRSMIEPFLSSAKNRALREEAFRIWTSRGDHRGPNDNGPIVQEILKLRTERSKLLGFATFAHWRLADTMAADPKPAMDLMLKVWRPAVARARMEVAEMQALVDREGGQFKIQPWDYRFYAEQVCREQFDLDMDAVNPYLQLEKIREAMFWMAGELYGLSFARVSDVPVYHPDVSVYRVTGQGGKNVGLWYFDPYARPGKLSGAWMSNYREQGKMDGEVLPLVSNNSNFIPGAPDEPVTISWADAVTMFHEFGHALHSLLSNVTYTSVSGTNTFRDFVELPSQLHEKFLRTDEVFKFLTNVRGEPLPQDLIMKLDRAKTFNQGFHTVEFLAAAIVDMKLHLADGPVADPAAFEQQVLRELGMPSEIVLRHRIPHFSHIFSSEGYAAGYYGYLWAQVLDHDAFEAFSETGNVFDKQVAQRLLDCVLSVGNTVDPNEAYRRFRGREATVDALLRARGFPIDGVALAPTQS